MTCDGAGTFRKPDRARNWVAAALKACGMPGEDADLAASRLIRADMRGIRTHGLALLPAYVESLQAGHTNPVARIRVEHHDDTLIADADNGLGHVVMARVLAQAIPAAATRGVLAVSIHRTGHLGALGTQILDVAEANLIGVLIQNTQPLVGAEGATKPAIGNNPFAFAIPVPGGAPIVFDAAISTVSLSRVLAHARQGIPIPEDWALDGNGRPTTDASEARVLLPFGGYKGLALAMLFETLAGSLTGMRPERVGSVPVGNGAFLLLLNPERFLPRAAFDDHVTEWTGRYRQSGPQVRLPGERAARLESESRFTGIELSPELKGTLDALAARIGLEPI